MTASPLPAIHISGLRKDFKLYSHPRQILGELLFGRHIPLFTALEDIRFKVGQGEVVGIMGRNGAGKSTLLRIIAGTLDASAGSVEVNGRISAILELGTGFNMEYSGRENIKAGCACLGMSSREIAAKMDSIIDFSELREFIDHPFKTYSSGMQARLTFAAAIAVEPEILIVDEALAVGDAAFQAKCYAKIREFREAGGTILLVTHAENVVTRFCDRAILLERGRLILDGKPDAVVTAYMEMIYAKEKCFAPAARPLAGGAALLSGQGGHEDFHTPEGRAACKARVLQALDLAPALPRGMAKRVGSAEEAEILDLAILDADGQRVTQLSPGSRYTLAAVIVFYREIQGYKLGFTIHDGYGTLVCGIDSSPFAEDRRHFAHTEPGLALQASLEIVMHLTNGSFVLGAGIADSHNADARILDFFMHWLPFTVKQSDALLHASFVDLEPKNFRAVAV